MSVAFASVHFVASRRKAEREHVEFVKGKLLPLANECIGQAHERTPELRGVLTVQVSVVPDGKLDATIEGFVVTAASEVQEPRLVACMREGVKTVKLKLPLPNPEQLELSFPM